MLQDIRAFVQRCKPPASATLRAVKAAPADGEGTAAAEQGAVADGTDVLTSVKGAQARLLVLLDAFSSFHTKVRRYFLME